MKNKKKNIIIFISYIGIFCIFALLIMGVYKADCYFKYTEEHLYELQEVRDGTYVFYKKAPSSRSYDKIIVRYNNQIYILKGTISIQQTNDKPFIKITSKPHLDYDNDIAVSIPKGTIEFVENMELE